MEVAPKKKAKTCPDHGIADGAKTPTAAEQIAELQAELVRRKTEHDQELQAELDKCKREKSAMEERHNQTVRDLSRRHDQVVCDLVGEKNTMEERHDQVVRDLKGSYSAALEWAYSVETIPREHWLEKGHTEDYADAMETFLDELKVIIKGLRTGEICVRFGVTIAFGLRDEEGYRINGGHDDALMPYWSELANALIHWSKYHANRETLGLSFYYYYIDTPDAVLDVLRPAIKQSKVKYISFKDDGTPKTWKFAEFMEDIIQTNHTLTRVGFNGIVLSIKGWKAICNAIRIRNAGQASAMQLFQLFDYFDDGMNIEVLKEILTSTTASGDKEMEVWLGGNRCPRKKRQS